VYYPSKRELYALHPFKGGTNILILNAKVITMAGKNYEPGCVLIEDRIIKKISSNIDAKENNDGSVLDVKGAWVLPGLIDAHSHIGIFEEKIGKIGDSSNETTEPITPYIKAVDAINPMDSAFHSAIKTGVTSVMVGPGSSNVVGGQFVFIKTNGRCIDNMIVMEPAAIKIAFGENPKTNYGNNNQMPSSRMTIGFMLREELFEAKQYADSKKAALDSGDGFEEDIRKECWLPVLNKEIPLKAHVHRADDILTAIRIAKLFDLNLTLDHCTEGHLIADEIKKSGFPAIVGPSLASRNKTETQFMDFKTAGILHKAGIKVAITTDHPVTLIQCLPICAGIAAKEGLGIEEGLKAITINAAEICNVASRVGSLEIGKDADLAIFDGNPMEVFTNCLYTIIDGQIVYKADCIS
jgi:imidazolonepropionase-like amidohydrolase